MNIKLLSIILSLVVAVALLPGLATIQAGASLNHPEMQEGSQQMQEKPAPAPRRTQRRTRSASRGVPKGVGKCIERLETLANRDPLPAYEGQPQQIVNNGLLWNDPKSNCSIGEDSALRKKVSDLAVAWRAKNTERVRTLLGEIKSAVPQSTAPQT